MAGNQGTDGLLFQTNFLALRKQAQDMATIQTAGDVKKVTYIQAGELWFATLCICSTTLMAVFIYGISYYFILYNRRWKYEIVEFRNNMVRILGMGEDNVNGASTNKRHIPPRALVEHILSPWSCALYLACMALLCIHCLIRVLFSYGKEMQHRLLFSIMQLCCSCLALLASTFSVLIYRRCAKAYPADTVNLSQCGKIVLYKLHCESVWSLHLVVSVLILDDILVLVAITSYDPVSGDGISLTELLYIWQAVFIVYIIGFSILDAWWNNEVVILSYILMVIILCEIPARNYKAMSQDSAYLGTSLIALLILGCLTSRIVLSWARHASKHMPHFKSE